MHSVSLGYILEGCGKVSGPMVTAACFLLVAYIISFRNQEAVVRCEYPVCICRNVKFVTRNTEAHCLQRDVTLGLQVTVPYHYFL